MRVVGTIIVWAAVVAGFGQPTHTYADTQPKIILIRGFLDVFSTGLDELGNKLQQAGFRDVLVVNHAGAGAIQGSTKMSHSSPLVVIGHSLGANEAIRLAASIELGGGKVDLLVTFDPTERLVIPARVGTAINIFQRNGMARPASIPTDFRGEVLNIDLTTNPNVVHTNIEKIAELHALVVRKVAELPSKGRVTSSSTSGRAARRH